MSKSKAPPQSGTVKIDGVEITYALVRNDNGVQALWRYKGKPIRTAWRISLQAVARDVTRSYQQQLELEAQHARELAKLEAWNKGLPIFGGGARRAAAH